MEALLYFAFWALFLFLMMRFGCGAHVLGHRRPHDDRDAASPGDTELRWIPPETDRDPVCGKSVRTDAAKSSVHRGTVYYFCSRECREIFEASPDEYLDSGHSHALTKEHSHA